LPQRHKGTKFFDAEERLHRSFEEIF